MKRTRKLIILGIIVVIGIGIYNCGMKKNSSDNKKNTETDKVSELVLNERQKEVLKEVGLPTKVEELNISQKSAIIAIDEMLTAMEEKYHRSFSYSGYVENGLLEKEHLIAYPSDGDSYYDSFEVRKIKGENGIEYEDEYMNVVLRDNFSIYMTKIASEVFHTDSVKVFSNITYTTLTEVPSDEKIYNGAVSSINSIYVDGLSINEEEFQSYVAELEKKLHEKKLDCRCGIICLKKNQIENLNRFNYSDYTDSEYYTQREQIIVNE